MFTITKTPTEIIIRATDDGLRVQQRVVLTVSEDGKQLVRQILPSQEIAVADIENLQVSQLFATLQTKYTEDKQQHAVK